MKGKLLMASLVMTLLIGIASASASHPEPQLSGNPISISPTPMSSSGSHHGHNLCMTVWAWNGKEWVKRDVVYRQTLYKGQMVDNIMRGSQCKVTYSKPMQPKEGMVDDLSPLPMNWWKK